LEIDILRKITLLQQAGEIDRETSAIAQDKAPAQIGQFVAGPGGFLLPKRRKAPRTWSLPLN